MRNLAQIGYEVQSLEDFQALAETAFRLGKMHRAGRNQYYCYTDPSGAELWTQIDENDEIAGMNAHFHSDRTLEVTLLRAQAYDNRPLDGTFEARPLHAAPSLPATEQPPTFAFDLPDAHLVPSVHLPARATVQLAGFAREIHCYQSVEDYRNAHPGQRLEAVRPLDSDLGMGLQLSSLVRLDGIVVDAHRILNASHRHHFYHIVLSTAIGVIDIVASSRSIPFVPSAGQVIDGQVRLSGRVRNIDTETQRPGLVERFFWGAHSNVRLER